MLTFNLKNLLRRKRKRRRAAIEKPRSTVAGYYRSEILLPLRQPALLHPTPCLWLREQVRRICRKRVGTELAAFLNELAEESNDSIVRSALFKKCLELRRGYLESHKEYSDRRLIMLAERHNLFDKWEGIHILGCYGKETAQRYLQEAIAQEKDEMLSHAMRNALRKIEANQKRRREERGF